MIKKEDSGKVFDNSLYLISLGQVKRCIEHYFTDKEIKGKTILDAGCRLGEYSEGFAKKGAKKVIGIDLSKKAVEFANKNNKNENVEFINCDIRNLSRFKDNSFDIIFCIGTMPYIPKKEINRVMREFFRVIHPEGIILILFQKEKGFAGKFARFIANVIPFGIWMSITNNLSHIFVPIASALLHRKISKEYLKYGIFLSLRGVHFGIPADFESKFSKFRIKTAECENYSEETTASYKIINKK